MKKPPLTGSSFQQPAPITILEYLKMTLFQQWGPPPLLPSPGLLICALCFCTFGNHSVSLNLESYNIKCTVLIAPGEGFCLPSQVLLRVPLHLPPSPGPSQSLAEEQRQYLCRPCLWWPQMERILSWGVLGKHNTKQIESLTVYLT